MCSVNQNKKVGFWRRPKRERRPGDLSYLEFPVGFRERVKQFFMKFPIENSAKEDQTSFLDKLAIVEKKAKVVYARGYSPCRICKKNNCCGEFTYKGFVWPEGYSHYLRDHGVAVDPDFKQMVDAD